MLQKYSISQNLLSFMIKALFFILITLWTCTAGAQDITGAWYGTLKVQGMQLRLVFHIIKTDTGEYSATMDSPDQGAKGIPVTSANYRNSTLILKIAPAGIIYEAKLNIDNIFEGTFNQSGLKLPLNLSREESKIPVMNRPQEPKPPFPYYIEEVKFENKIDSITLAGTLTMPSEGGLYPAVILISGSGPQNRDEQIFGHKPFLVMADYLTKNGFAVLRFDDRGMGESTGIFQSATTEDFARDVESAVNFLRSRKEIDRQKIGLIGHSEGGLIAPIVANASADIRFMVLLAAPGLRGDKLLLLQQRAIGKAMGTSDEQLRKSENINENIFEIVVQSNGIDTLQASLVSYIKNTLNSMPEIERPAGNLEDYARLQAKQLTSPWMIHFLKYDPVAALERVRCPVLALYGEKDLQVPPSPNLATLKAALERGGNKDVTTKVLPGLNHLFQESESGLPSEYNAISQTFSPVALKEIKDWMVKQTDSGNKK